MVDLNFAVLAATWVRGHSSLLHATPPSTGGRFPGGGRQSSSPPGMVPNPIYIYRNTFRGEINDSVIPSISIWCPRCCRKSSEFFHPPAQRQPSNDGPPSATNASPGALGSPAPGALGSPRARAVRVFQTPTAVERAPAQSSAHRAFSGKGFPNMLSALKERPNEAKRFYALYPPVLLGLDQISHIALIRPIRV